MSILLGLVSSEVQLLGWYGGTYYWSLGLKFLLLSVLSVTPGYADLLALSAASGSLSVKHSGTSGGPAGHERPGVVPPVICDPRLCLPLRQVPTPWWTLHWVKDGVFLGLWLLLHSESLDPMSVVFVISISMFLNALLFHARPPSCNPFAVSSRNRKERENMLLFYLLSFY